MGVKVNSESRLMTGKKSISSQSLFHFTGSLSILKKILKDQHFLVRECEEHHWGGYKFSVPMACFCDIPLSKISSHINQYGCYGIGMSSQWANDHKLCSVIYVRNKSELSNWVNKTLRRITMNRNCMVCEETIYILSRIKKYKGIIPNKKDDKTCKGKYITFYDEREWRFVPKRLTIQDIKTSKEYENLDLQDKEKLPFTLSDIEYIIIKNESERKDIIKAINKIKSEKDSLDILKSKILTVKQIEQDF